jgi:hypothetical protein
VTSRFFYTPVTAASSAGADSLAARGGLSLSGSAGAGGWGLFSFGFARAGVAVEDAGDDAVQAGRQLLTLGGRLTPARRLAAEIRFRRSAPTEGDAGSGADTDTSLALTLTPGDRTRIGANLDRSAAGPGGATQTLGLSVDARPTQKMQVSASYSGKDAPGAAPDSQALDLKTTLTPGPALSLEASASRSRLGGATTDQQALALSLAPRPTVQLQAGLALRQRSAAGAPDAVGTAAASVSGTLRPLSFLEFSGSYKSRRAPAPDTDPQDLLDTSTAQVSLSPLRAVRLVGTYAQNPDDGGDTLQRLARKGLGLETTLGALGLSGGYDWSRRLDAADAERTVHADLGLRFSRATRLTVGFQTQQNLLAPDAPPATAYTVGFTHALGDRFSLSLSGKRTQDAAPAPPDINASANLGVKF